MAVTSPLLGDEILMGGQVFTTRLEPPSAPPAVLVVLVGRHAERDERRRRRRAAVIRARVDVVACSNDVSHKGWLS